MEIERITCELKQDNFKNEAEVSQGVVSALLNVLGWNAFNVNEVTREYGAGNGRVDYALCNKPRKPYLFIEVKAVGKGDGEEQLFRYAFDEGVPMLILTDGREWTFYLTAEQGRYNERQFYKLDLLERSPDDCVSIFYKFLHKENIVSGSAKEEAQKIFKSKQKNEEVKRTLPEAWSKLLEEPDELLRDLLTEKVQTICGHKPEDGIAEDFLRSVHTSEQPVHNLSLQETQNVRHGKQKISRHNSSSGKITGIRYKKDIYKVKTAIDALEVTLSLLAEEDINFLPKLKSVTETKSRNLVSRDKNKLYKKTPTLLRVHIPRRLPNGWWMGTNMSREQIEKRIKQACVLSGVSFGKGKDFEILRGHNK